ncbi:hypothetical protein INR49_002046 [Caranx melampygus]|nr:hypothetical protein INR49_002046 [Caranx melampygus]
MGGTTTRRRGFGRHPSAHLGGKTHHYHEVQRELELSGIDRTDSRTTEGSLAREWLKNYQSPHQGRSGQSEKEKLAEFVEELLDRKEEPRVRRNAVDGESYLVVTNVLVSLYREQSSGDEHFVDTHEVELISRVTNVNPILDELYAKKVIGDEKFAEISAQQLLMPR